MKLKLFLLASSLTMALPVTTYAASTTGTIAATLTLTTGCLVNGQSATTGVNFGSLNFGTSAATFDSLGATLVGSSGNGIYVRCTTGQTFNVQVTGSNTAPATVYGTVSTQPRYLRLGSDNTQGIAYTIYSDAAYTTAIANNTNIAASGTTDATLGTNYAIYGRIVGGGYNPIIPAGTYTDTINVSVNY
ncbi:spore coat protein U domain-containing protein [Candidatus Pantoea formicae]|uniref:SCPU domain-containing protein n=1 Tax=Candidatus Pantoea formicae TaxID=2608355 RepID=A0ABX0QY78_9GAMM|nr:spore coat protein U domain-containing protein [Pantoea formicae]MDF7648283.1 spore coat protein U domain-containing protein [Erwiniaceae bacterium L1_54_3]NIF01902.1 SCPU domain-containing protein [Pantoea formicae]